MPSGISDDRLNELSKKLWEGEGAPPRLTHKEFVNWRRNLINSVDSDLSNLSNIGDLLELLTNPNDDDDKDMPAAESFVSRLGLCINKTNFTMKKANVLQINSVIDALTPRATTAEEESNQQIVEMENREIERKFNREDRVSTESHCLIVDIFRVLDPTSRWQLEDLLLFTDHSIYKLLLFYEACLEDNPELKHPFTPLVRAYQYAISTKQIHTVSMDHANGCSPISYTASEVIRNRWEIKGDLDTVMVDGEPIVTHTHTADRQFYSQEYRKKGKAYVPKASEGDAQLCFETSRWPPIKPTVLIAYEEFGNDLRSPLAADIAQLMTIAYAINGDLRLTSEQGARLLARDREGRARRIRNSDIQRFEYAFAGLHGMAVWITGKDGIHRLSPLISTERTSLVKPEVIIAAPEWFKRDAGSWTLTAGFGGVGRNRLKGNIHNNNIWRVIMGVEYWLARGPFHVSGRGKGIPKALTSADNKKTGAGTWHPLHWTKLLMIAGDVWNRDDKTAENRARQRYKQITESLKQAGYDAKKPNGKAEVGDTVEFLWVKRGEVWVRATDRFVQAAKLAKEKKWERVKLVDWLGFAP